MVRAYSRMQAALVAAWADAVRADCTPFRSTPHSGTIEHRGMRWEYTRHGAGVRFNSDQGVLDAHIEIATEPTAVDGWRLWQFCESRGIEALTFDGKRFDATDDRALHELLRHLSAAGHITRAPTDCELFTPRAPRAARGGGAE